eukprot:maker-scaffold_22-snap-gene-5.14-mRNA-1 protein AED:0.02 eAED:0.02 QI:223/1/1/1/1/1/3/25/336
MGKVKEIVAGAGILSVLLGLGYFLLPRGKRRRKIFLHWMANSGKVPKGVEPRSLPEISKLASNVYRVMGCNPGNFTLQGTNCYLVGTGENRILIDAGEGKQKFSSNLKNLLETEHAHVKYLLITHKHFDHLGGCSDVVKISPQCTVKKFISSPVDDELGVECKPLEDGEVLEVTGARIRVMHTPGHTKDHVCFLLENESQVVEAIFSGDCVLGSGTAVFEDLSEYMTSLSELMKLEKLNPDALMYPGHGEVVKDAFKKIKYYIDHRNQREEQIFKILSEKKENGTSISEIVEAIYGELNLSWKVKIGAKNSVKHHLSKLIKENKVKAERNKYFAKL